MNPLDILGPTPRRAYRLSWTARLAAWLHQSPAPRRATDHAASIALREAVR